MQHSRDNRKRIGITARALSYTFFLIVFFTAPAYAYLDPSVMTYAIQAIAGVAIALSTFFGMAWRKFRKNILHIDTSHYKTFESDDLSFTDPQDPEHVIRALEYELPAAQMIPADQIPTLRKKKLTGKEKFRAAVADLIPGVILSAAFSYMIAFYAPLEIYMNNKAEFWFDFGILMPQMLQLSLLLFCAGVVVFIASYLIFDKLYHVLLAAGGIVYLCTYIQGNYLVGHMPPSDGTDIIWHDYVKDMMVSAVLLVIVTIVISLLIRFFDMPGYRKISVFMCVAITLMLTVSLISINAKTDGTEPKAQSFVLTDEDIFKMSTDNSFVILILDAMDAQVGEELIEEYPDYQKAFKDFTYYPDTIAAYPYTSRSIPFILTGKWYENKEVFEDFVTEAMDESPLIKELDEKQYTMYGYSPYIISNNDTLFKFSNIKQIDKKLSSPKRFKALELKLALYKYMPYYLKKLFHFEISDFAEVQYIPDVGADQYAYYNSNFKHLLKNAKIETADGNMFKFIHIEGGHVPFNFNKDLKKIDSKTGDYTDKASAALTLAENYLNLLKDADVYDNSTIIIMSDHGFYAPKQDGTNRHNPLLMIKSAESKKEAMTVNNAPLSYDDLQDVYHRLLNGSDSDDITDYKEGDKRTRRFIAYFPFTDTDHMKEIEYYGKASEYDNKKYTGNEYVFKN